MGSKIYDSTYKDQKAIVMESSSVAFKFLPDFGGNIASIIDKKTSKEFLVQRPEVKYRTVPFDGSYVDAECSGLDDMFPTIDTCYYQKEPWAGTKLADHGEVWNLKSKVQTGKDDACFTFYGIRLPYVFEKRAHFLSDSILQIDYKVINNTQFDMDFLWAAHTMLNAEPGVKVLVPRDLKKAISVFTSTGRIGRYGEEFDWPEYTDKGGVKRDAGIMGARENNCEKYYFKDALKKGWCAAQYPDNSIFALSFPPEKIPYLGILHNQGSFRNIYNLFLEPCSASFDRPDFAAVRGQNSVVKASSTYKWYLNITIGKATSVNGVDAKGAITN
jgi:hypothetical protein